MRYAEYSLGCTGRKKYRFNYFKTQKSLEQKLKNSTVQHYFLTPAFFINQTQLGTWPMGSIISDLGEEFKN